MSRTASSSSFFIDTGNGGSITIGISLVVVIHERFGSVRLVSRVFKEEERKRQKSNKKKKQQIKKRVPRTRESWLRAHAED